MLIMETLEMNGMFQAIRLVIIATVTKMAAASPLPIFINCMAYRKGTIQGVRISQER